MGTRYTQETECKMCGQRKSYSAVCYGDFDYDLDYHEPDQCVACRALADYAPKAYDIAIKFYKLSKEIEGRVREEINNDAMKGRLNSYEVSKAIRKYFCVDNYIEIKEKTDNADLQLNEIRWAIRCAVDTYLKSREES
jgi:hypothetical protein